MTKFEHFIREQNERLSISDIAAINKLTKDWHENLNEYEIQEAEKIISEKHINPSFLSRYYLADMDDPKAYNRHVTAVWKCMNKAQWNLVKKYYTSLYISQN